MAFNQRKINYLYYKEITCQCVTLTSFLRMVTVDDKISLLMYVFYFIIIFFNLLELKINI